MPDRQVLPVPVDVAVPIERTSQAGALELGGGLSELLVVELGGIGALSGETVTQPPAGRDEKRPRVPAGRQSGVEAHKPAAHVRFDLGLGPAGLLEIADVELLVAADLREDLGRSRAPGGVYGTPSSPTAANMSGRVNADAAAIGEPQS